MHNFIIKSAIVHFVVCGKEKQNIVSVQNPLMKEGTQKTERHRIHLQIIRKEIKSKLIERLRSQPWITEKTLVRELFTNEIESLSKSQ